jgi:hypothetical protein
VGNSDCPGRYDLRFCSGKNPKPDGGFWQTQVMYEYGNWKSDCSSHGGIVKVLTKPQHGKLTPVRENVTIRASRFPRDMSCYGKQILGFVVYYTPQPQFVGFDTFAIEVTYPGHPPDVDTFSVNVK